MFLKSLAKFNFISFPSKQITIFPAKLNKIGINSSLLSAARNHLVYYPTPNNFYYIFGVGSLLGIMLVIQVITGVLLAMHYVPNIDLAFESVERIMREVPTG